MFLGFAGSMNPKHRIVPICPQSLGRPLNMPVTSFAERRWRTLRRSPTLTTGTKIAVAAILAKGYGLKAGAWHAFVNS